VLLLLLLLLLLHGCICWCHCIPAPVIHHSQPSCTPPSPQGDSTAPSHLQHHCHTPPNPKPHPPQTALAQG
jgi:hypothetical protein